MHRRELPQAEWWLGDAPIAGPTTAAAALRQLGAWSLDGDKRDFDAEEWTFRARFDSFDGAQVLGFDGLATIAEVTLNGEKLIASDNMFVAHCIDVEKLLRRSGNELVIRCAPLAEALKAKRPRPRWRAPMIANQQLRWWRTTLLGRTPGWSLPAAPVGPWRDVWLGTRDALIAESLRIDASVEGDDGIVRCSIAPQEGAHFELRLSRDGTEWTHVLADHGGTLRIPQVARWWPHTHGEPALYEARLVIRRPNQPCVKVPLAPIGFRTIAVDKSNGGFGVSVNDVPVFCRGAVWTPLDAVSFRASADQYAQSLAQVGEAGMNMLRVAGPMVYEEDAFYEACDRAGVLVWQDFMFANMDYPASDEAFARSVETEVRQQLQRLHAHPSVAVLCGNSEGEQQPAMWGALREVWEQPLFHETLPCLCRELAPGIPYWPSSTHGGALPQQPDTGTTSYYGVGAYLRPLSDARTSNLKFATECLAFANVPAASTIARMPPGPEVWKARTPRDLNADWDFEDVRDHYLKVLHGAVDSERYLDLSRQVTGEVMARCFADWRRPGSTCRGALILMLRDFWPGAGWGLLDDEGVPKPCWDALKPVLQPLVVLLTDEGMNGLYAHLVNERPEDRRCTLQLHAWRGDGVQVEQAERRIELMGRSATTIALASLLDHFTDLIWSHRFGEPPCNVVACTLLDDTGAALSEARWELGS